MTHLDIVQAHFGTVHTLFTSYDTVHTHFDIIYTHFGTVHTLFTNYDRVNYVKVCHNLYTMFELFQSVCELCKV